jgi:hypothetical protein
MICPTVPDKLRWNFKEIYPILAFKLFSRECFGDVMQEASPRACAAKPAGVQ